jgi:uncharacterized membrane protein
MEPERHPDSLLVPRNLPYLVSGLYLLGFLVAFIPPLVGFIFCFALAEKTPDSWVNTHLSYQKRTFVGGLVYLVVLMLIFGGSIISAAVSSNGAHMTSGAAMGLFGGLMFFILAMLVWMGWTGARCIISILKCNEQLPMPNPKSWLW